MKSLTEVLAISLLACAVAVAQGAPAGSPKPDQTRQTPPDRDSSQGIPGQGTSSTNQDTGINQAGSTASDSSATDASHTSADNENKGGKKLKGCLRSANGQYMLETKHDKMVSLTGSEDFGPHVGHTVTLHGRFVEGQKSAGPMSEHPDHGDMSGTSGSKSPTGTSSGADQSDTSSSSFQVTKMEMVSDSCSLDGKNGMKSEKNSAPDHQ